MADFPSFSDYFRLARDEVLTRNPRISRDAVERDGMDANVLVASACAAADEVTGQLIDVAASLYLDSAKGTALDKLVFDRYGLTRKPAAAAQGSINFYTATANPSLFTIPAGTSVKSSDGIQYITTTAVDFPLGAVGPVLVAIRSVLAGAGQQAKAGTITSLAAQIAGAPSGLTVNNTLATSGADDAESDDSLRDRARRFFSTARRGTKDALEAGALSVPGIRKATAIEVLDSYGRPARSVQLVVTDAFTERLVDYTSTPPAYAVQSQVISNTVYAALNDYRAQGIYVDVIVASVVLQGIQMTLAFQAGVDVDLVALQARAAIAQVVNTLAPGKPLTVAALQAVLTPVAGLVLTGGEIVSPAGDVVPTAVQVLRTTLALVSAVSADSDRPLAASGNPDAYGA